jgi:hypothetical protein
MNTSTVPPPVLGSWKEIAAFFGKGTRTVQRWEHDFGLPVRRPAGKPLGMVSASRTDLEKWWASQWIQKEIGNDSFVPTPLARPADLYNNIQQSRELRHRNRELSGELAKCMKDLRQSCEAMASKLKGTA